MYLPEPVGFLVRSSRFERRSFPDLLTKRWVLTDLFHLVCAGCVVESQKADQSDLYGWSCRNLRDDVGCEGKNFTMRTAF